MTFTAKPDPHLDPLAPQDPQQVLWQRICSQPLDVLKVAQVANSLRASFKAAATRPHDLPPAHRKLSFVLGSGISLAALMFLAPNLTSYAQTADEYFKEGISRMSSRDFRGAIDSFSKALELNPEDALAYGNRGGARALLGNFTEACKDFKQGMKLGDCPTCTNNYNKICASQD